MVSILISIMKSVMLKNELRKLIKEINHGLPEFASGPPLGGRPDVNSGRP